MSNPMLEPIEGRALPYAFWHPVTDDATGQALPGIGARQITVFSRHAEVSAVSLPCAEHGGVSSIRIEAFTDCEDQGKPVFEEKVRPVDGEVKAEFAPTSTWAMSIAATVRTPLLPNQYDWYRSTYTVSHSAFAKAQWMGRYTGITQRSEPPAPPPLRSEVSDCVGTSEVQMTRDPYEVRFRSRWLDIGFSLVRPRLTYLAWDGLGTGRLDTDFLAQQVDWTDDHPGSGPWIRSVLWPAPSAAWSGRIEVRGQRVIYKELASIPGYTLDAAFEVDERGFALSLDSTAIRSVRLLEFEPWRFVWDGKRLGSVSVLSAMRRGPHRKGLVENVGGFHVSGFGALTFEQEAGDSLGWMVDTTGYFGRRATAGLVLGCEPRPDGGMTLLPGEHHSRIRFAVGNVEPALSTGVDREAARSLRRGWGSVFAYRAEHAGLSNNSFSINAQNCLHFPAELALHTATTPPLPDMMVLVRDTLDLALRGGPGYAADFHKTADTAPSQLIAAGNVWRKLRDADWLKRAWPWIRPRLNHLLESRDESGMYLNLARTGQSGSTVSCANAWDTFVFGHADGYSAALAYPALRAAADLAAEVGDTGLASTCRDSARRLKDAYLPVLMNPETGWLAGWRDTSGQLHDHAFVQVNAMAIAYGLIEGPQAEQIMERLEAERMAQGFTDFRFGLPPQLHPVAAQDFSSLGGYHRSEVPHRADGADTFGVFTNGGLTPIFAGYYLDSLQMTGRTDTAERIAQQLLESFDAARFDGSRNGAESYTQDGLCSGYEGTLSHSFHVLLAVAKLKNWLVT